MNKLEFFIKRVFYPACAVYAFLSLAVLLLSSTVVDKPALTINTMLLFLFMSFLIALSGMVFELKRISLFFRTLIHMGLSLVSVVASLYIFNFFGASGDLSVNKLLLAVFFCVIYLIIAVPIIIFSAVFKDKKERNTQYSSMFKKK